MTTRAFLAASALVFVAFSTVTCNPVAAPAAGSADKAHIDLRSVAAEMKRDCMQLLQLFDQFGNQEQFERYHNQLDACAQLIIASDNGQLAQATKLNQEQESESANGKPLCSMNSFCGTSSTTVGVLYSCDVGGYSAHAYTRAILDSIYRKSR